MKYIDDINLFKSNKDFVAEIDMTGSLGRIYHYPQRMEGCLFLLCLRGECDITIHLSEHKIQKNDIVTILPETFVHVHRQSPDCRLYLIGFNKELLNGINLFNSTMNYLSALIDTPIIPLRPEITELFQDYFLLLIKMKRMGAKPNKDLISKCTEEFFHSLFGDAAMIPDAVSGFSLFHSTCMISLSLFVNLFGVLLICILLFLFIYILAYIVTFL